MLRKNREASFFAVPLKMIVSISNIHISCAAPIVANRDEKVCIAKDDRGFLVDLIVAEDGWLGVVGVGSKVVISSVLLISNLPCCISINLQDRRIFHTVIRSLLSSLFTCVLCG